MTAVVVIDDERGLTVEVHHINQTNKSTLLLYKFLTFLLNSCTQATRWSSSVIKVGAVYMGKHVSRCLKEELAWV